MTDKFAKIFPTDENGMIDKGELTRTGVSLIPTVLMVMVIIATSFISTLFQFHFSLKEIIWSQAITSISLRILLQLSSKYVAGDTRIRRRQERDPILKNKTAFEELSEKLNAKDFFAWVDDYNLKLKRRAYENEVNAKMARLRAKLSRVNATAMRKGKNPFGRTECLKKKIADLEAVSTDEYINANLVKLHVKIRPIRALDFLAGEDSAGTKEIYTVNPQKDLSLRIARGVPFAMFMSLLGAVFGYTFSTGQINAMSLVFDLLSIGISLYMGAFVSGDGTVSAINAAYLNRIKILRLYYSEKEA